MVNRQKVRLLDKLAKRYGSLPSALMGIEHPVAAYWLNEAVGWFGEYVDIKLEERDPATGKTLYSIESLLGIEPEAISIDLSQTVGG